MEDPLSDGKENVADIFMLSNDETATVPLRESLEKKGYRVCMVPAGTQLKAILNREKPGLLIYDSKIGDTEGYDLIREIKADETWRAIPTLVLTRASAMEDLLRIIESNTDNFIAPPYDHPDHLSLIESMLATHAGGYGRDGAVKQFTVRHDEYTYTIAATNRKLLEYLLSSFEILAGRSSELSDAETKLGMVLESVRELESRVADQTRDIEILNADIRQKEQRNIELAREYDHITTTLSQKTDEIQNLTMECDNTRTRLESAGNSLDEEKIRSESLKKQVIDLTSALDQQKSELLAERDRFSAAEQELSRLKQEKIRSENELNRIINGLNETTNLQKTEIDRLKGEVEAQTKLGESAEREIIALKQEKIRSENELNRIINGLNETTNLQKAEIDRLKGEIGAETDRRISAENQAGSLVQEVGQLRSSSLSETEALRQKVAGLEETLGESAAALETERKLRRTSEEKTGSLVRRQEELEKQIGSLDEELGRAKETASNALHMKEDLETAATRVHSLEDDIRRLAAEKTVAVKDVKAVTAGPGHEKTLPAVERQDIQAVDSEHADAGKERHLVQQPLFRPGEPTASHENEALVISGDPHLPMVIQRESGDEFAVVGKPGEKAEIQTIADPDSETPGNPAGFSEDLKPREALKETAGKPGKTIPAGDIPFTSNQWLDLLKWAHHSEALSEDQRLRIIRMGRLIQKDRKLTKNQQDQVREILSLVNALGFQAR